MLKTTPGTKVESAPNFDRHWYRAQTLLQFLLAATVLAGLAGIFGGGLAAANRSCRVKHHRI